MAEARDVRSKAVSLQKCIVNLDIKVKKWKDCPDAVKVFLAEQRGRSKAIVDALLAFTGVQKTQDSQRMEAARAALEGVDIKVPKAFNVLMFKEKACDFIRFRDLDPFVEHVQGDGSGYIQDGMFADADAVRDLLLDVHADALKALARGFEMDPHHVRLV